MSGVQKSTKEIAVFLIVTFGLSTIFYIPFIAAGSVEALGMLGVLGLMWCPGIAAIATCLLFRKGIHVLGWRLGKGRYLLIAFLLPLVFLSVYIVVWTAGLGEMTNSFGDKPLLKLLVQFLIMLLFDVVLALGEEIGWRGYLVPRLAETHSFTQTAIISGFIWGVWHYPLILFADYNSNAPVWYALVMFTLMLVGESFAYAWLRLKSGSLWTAVILHGSHNFFIQNIFDELTVDTGMTEYITGEFGVGIFIIGVILAYVFWTQRRSLPPTTHS